VFLQWELVGNAEGRHTLRTWTPDDVPTLGPNDRLRIRVAMRNIGDALGDPVLTNFVVPDCLTLEDASGDNESQHATNLIAGVAPEDVVWFIAQATTLAGGDWLVREYVVTPIPGAGAQRVRLLFDLSCPRFNATGNKWLPSLVVPFRRADEVSARVGEQWPAQRIVRRPVRVRSEPHVRVRCVPGGRSDIREVDIDPTK
jgi:hypothetical protein